MFQCGVVLVTTPLAIPGFIVVYNLDMSILDIDLAAHYIHVATKCRYSLQILDDHAHLI